MGQAFSIDLLLENASIDVAAIIILSAIWIFYGLMQGKRHILSVLLSLYISKVIYDNVPFVDIFLKGKEFSDSYLFLIDLGFFIVLILIIAVLMAKTVLIDLSSRWRWWKVGLVCILEVALFSAIVFRILDPWRAIDISPVMYTLFGSGYLFILWLLLPLASLFITIRRR